MTRPQRMSVRRLFVAPILLIAMTAFSIWASQTIRPSPIWELVAVLLVGAAAGAPIGWLRGRHSDVKTTQRPGVMEVHSSPLIVMLWLAVFAVRAIVRAVVPGARGTGVWADGLMAFAVSALIVSYFAIYAKFNRLDTEALSR